jgi:pyrimidine operon attenuation protein / uracil phosphoribosyltransferase
MGETVLLNAEDIQRSLKRLAHQLIEARHGELERVVLVGILTRGHTLALRLQALIQQFEAIHLPVGALDVSAYRDDGPKTLDASYASKTDMPISLEDRHVVLIDDVIYKGRTARAALDALLQFGRPSGVSLLVLLDRGHRELPISPNYVGKNIPTRLSEHIQLHLQETDGRDHALLFCE